MEIDLHPYKTIKFLKSSIESIERENVSLFRENREYKRGLGKDKEVDLALGRARYWHDRWLTLYRLLSESQKTREKKVHGTETL